MTADRTPQEEQPEEPPVDGSGRGSDGHDLGATSQGAPERPPNENGRERPESPERG